MVEFAVVDVETTGFGKTDRIIEISIVVVSNGRIAEEWETLLNPERDISNSEIHGLTASDVSLAPTFSEVADEIERILNGKILVAHNISFDQRMLQQEFERIGKEINFGIGFCTLQATGLSLARACETYGIENVEAHRALTDTRATAQILIQLEPKTSDLKVVQASPADFRKPSRVLCRKEPLGNDEKAGMQLVRKRIPDFDDTGFTSSQLSYADALYSVMSDFEITPTERTFLNDWAQAVAVSEEEQIEVHQDYLGLLIKAAQRDNFVSQDEYRAIEKAAQTLGVLPPLFEQNHTEKLELVTGVRVCFTGSAKGADGGLLTKEELAEIAIHKGLIPVETVTKKSCELVVAADESSMSGKAQKARKFGIRIITVEVFLAL